MTLTCLGHVTSSATWPFESQWAISYRRSIVTKSLSRRSRDTGPQHMGITTELAAGQLSRYLHKGPVASKFAGSKPSGISRVGCNVGGLPQALNKAENNRRTEGSASGYLGQPATWTDRQGCERLLKVTEDLCWKWRWTLRTFTVTVEFWHLMIS